MTFIEFPAIASTEKRGIEGTARVVKTATVSVEKPAIVGIEKPGIAKTATAKGYVMGIEMPGIDKHLEDKKDKVQC
jgi:hypothetical protein